MTDQSQVETEELRFGRAGRTAAVLALNAFPGVSHAHFSFLLASAVVVKQGLRALHSVFSPPYLLVRAPNDLHIKMNQKQVFCSVVQELSCCALLLNRVWNILFHRQHSSVVKKTRTDFNTNKNRQTCHMYKNQSYGFPPPLIPKASVLKDLLVSLPPPSTGQTSNGADFSCLISNRLQIQHRGFGKSASNHPLNI